MDLVSFDHEYYISQVDIQSTLKMTSQLFELRLEAYEYECKPLKRISNLDIAFVSCKTAYAFLSWHVDNSYTADHNLHALRSHLKKHSKKIPKRNLSRSMRIEIAFRQSYACNVCGLFPIPPTFEVDHIVEIADGGEDISSNLQALCPPCHRRKTKLNQLRKNKIFAEEANQEYQKFVPPNPDEPVFSKYFSKNTL
tara:strand:- start:86 stop:673 length:588 start_codon:yes stop_codon:yes gene_type:complete